MTTREQAIRAIKAKAGSVRFDDDGMARVTLVGLEFGDDDLELIATIDPRYVRLQETGITDNGLSHLASLTHAMLLDCSYTGITGRGLASIPGKELKELGLTDCPNLRDCELGSLTHFVNLEWLLLPDSSVGDEAMQHAGKLTRLQRLGVQGTQVTDIGLQYLTGLKSLKHLLWWRTSITEEGLSELQKSLPDLFWRYKSM